MKDINGILEIDGKTYSLVFNLNVLESIQAEYGSLENWGNLTDGVNGEPNAKAVIFGFAEMMNEGIDIQNDERGTNEPFLTRKQIGRLITKYGLVEATKKLNQTVIDSTQSNEKNA